MTPLFNPQLLKRLIIILVVIFFVVTNVILLRATPEVMLIQFVVVLFIFKRNVIGRFISDWMYLIGATLVYAWLRGIVDDIAPFKSATLFLVHNLEYDLLGLKVGMFLQQVFGADLVILYTSSILYNMYFFMILAVPFGIWVYRGALFKDYIARFICLMAIGLVFFYLIPTAPPWYVSDVMSLDFTRILYTEGLNSGLVSYGFVRYLLSDNLFAALPSFHVAWTVFQVTYLFNKFSKKFGFLFFVPLGVSFAVLYGAEHYVLDVLLGALLGVAFVYLNIGAFLMQLKKRVNPQP